MSDTDDTDVLLLIPPDFFLVPSSDSEDSIGPDVRDRYNKNNGFERFVVNDLITHVNELENRICLIERKNSVEIPKSQWDIISLHESSDYSALDSNNLKFLRQEDILKVQSMLTGDRYSGNSNLRLQILNSVPNSVCNTPVKQRQALSLPSTPSIDSNIHNLSSNSNISRHDDYNSLPIKSAISIEPMTPSEILSMSHPVPNLNIPGSGRDALVIKPYVSDDQQRESAQGSSLIGEIDQFLNSVKKNSKIQPNYNASEHDRKENVYRCGEYSASVPDRGFGLRDFNHLPVKEETVKSKYVYPLDKKEAKSVGQMELSEVNELLREIENPDVRDEKYSNPTHMSYEEKNIYSCGNNVDSQSQLSFGRSSFNSLPVREEMIKFKTVSPLEKHAMDIETGGLDLSDIEKLLKQMEITQHEIERKLQLREALFGKSDMHTDDILVPEKISLTGDTIGSIPDRGFGIRNIESLKPLQVPTTVSSGGGTRMPVHEETVVKRNITSLGTISKMDTITNDSQVSSSMEEADTQQIDKSSGDIYTKSEFIQEPNLDSVQKFDPKPGIISKNSATRRKLELGDDPSTVPDCGFGLKSWYQNSKQGYISEKDKEGCSESHLHSPHTLPHYAVDDASVVTTDDNQRTVLPSSEKKLTYVQGDFLPSIPDLGFGVRNLWTNTGQQMSTTSCIPKPLHSNTQAHRNKDVDAIEEPMFLLPQTQPCEAGQSKIVHQSHDQWIQKQRSSTMEDQPAIDAEKVSAGTEPLAKKKVDFTVSSGHGDTAVYGVQRNFPEGMKIKPEFRSPFPDSDLTTSVNSGASNLLSLSELWGKDGLSSVTEAKEGHNSIRLKFEEEKYRRQHCEILIQQLQSRLLEEQQKLAVAVCVDRGKDQAILQLQNAWYRLVHHWKELEEHRHSLASRLQSERKEYQKQENEITQKLKRLESELSKTLDIAKGYKEKFEELEKEKLELIEHHKGEIKQMIERVQEEESKVCQANKLNSLILQEKNESVEKVKQAEQEAQKERKLLIDAQKELQNTHKKVESFEAELSAVKEERETVQLKLKEEKGRISILDQQKKSLQAALDESRKKEKSLKEEVKQLTTQLEKIKVELREYYQQQLEVVVREKLQEFQEQLDAAETSLHKELEQREHAITDMASKQIQHISEKHQLEIQLLEEKHGEELQLYKLQLSQALQQASQLEKKLQGYNTRKSEIVEKLHHVMETQWQEALRIISGNSPLSNRASEDTTLKKKQPVSDMNTATWPLVTAADNSGAMSILKSQSHSELHARCHDTVTEPNEENLPKVDQFQTPTSHISMAKDSLPSFKNLMVTSHHYVPPLHLHQQSAGSSTAEEIPFNQDGLLTYRIAEHAATAPLPDTQTNQEDELKKYIMMLLDRSPGNPVEDIQVIDETETLCSKMKQNLTETNKRQEHVDAPTNEKNQQPKWESILYHDTEASLSSSRQQNIPTAVFNFYKTSQGSSKDGQHLKPPWK